LAGRIKATQMRGAMKSNKTLIQLITSNLSLKRDLKRVINNADGFEVITDEDSSRTDLIIFELSSDTDKDFQFLRSLLETGKATEIFLTAKEPTPKLLMQAIKIGAKEFFSLPIKDEEVIQALNNFKEQKNKLNDKHPTKTGKIINIIGSKGGVGTTTVAVNLAVSLLKKKRAESVALVDMNMLFGEIPLFLSIKPKHHWGDITQNVDRLDATFLTNIMTKHSSGVHVLPSPSYLNGHPAATPQVMDRLIELMRKMYDAIIIDGGQSLTGTSLRSIELSNHVLLVSLLSLPCLSNTTKLMKSFKTMGLYRQDKLHLVINRYLKKSEISLQDAEHAINNKIFWTIPNDYKASIDAINQGKPLVQVSAKSPVSRNFEGLADALIPQEEKSKKRRWKLFKR